MNRISPGHQQRAIVRHRPLEVTAYTSGTLCWRGAALAVWASAPGRHHGFSSKRVECSF